MAIANIRILCRIDFPSETVRLWDGTGPYIDAGGNLWNGTQIVGLDQIEAAINGEATMFEASLSGVAMVVSDTAWEELEAGDVIGSVVQILIQPCDANDQPVGAAEVRATATIDNLRFAEQVAGEGRSATVTAECTNRFNLRNLTSGSVLSDVDQRARSLKINPSAPADRFCERIPQLADHTISWPNL